MVAGGRLTAMVPLLVSGIWVGLHERDGGDAGRTTVDARSAERLPTSGSLSPIALGGLRTWNDM